jgi:acetyltransferase
LAAGIPLSVFLDPKSVAVVGASSDPAKVGGSVLANLRAGGFPGAVLAINSRQRIVQGLPALSSVLAIDGQVDLAVIAVAAPSVLPALKDCAAKGVQGAVVITAGFREAGPEGERREAELRAWLRDQPLRVLGPNCLGWIRPSRGLNLTFAPGMPRTGSLGFFSHSGALGTAILDWSREHDVGFSLFASLGNQADLNETDLLEALAEDAQTRVIIGYLEGVADGRRFFAALRAAAARKPCLLMKAGRSAEGARAVASHTGALAGSDRAFDAAVVQAGAIRARSLEELFDLAQALEDQPLPGGRKVVIVTNGGGLGILATDAAREAGIEVPPLDDASRERLHGLLPAHAALGNPVDLVGDATPARYGAALRELGATDATLLIMLAPQAATDAAGVARAILGAMRGRRSTVLAVLAGGARVRAGLQILEEGGIPCYAFPERAVRTLAGMATLAERRAARAPVSCFPVDRDRAVACVEALRAAGVERFGLLEGAPLLEAYGLRAIPCALARSHEEAEEVAARLGLPVALKIVSPEISHKTEVGGVRLGLKSLAEVGVAAKEMLSVVHAARPQARIEGVLVQPMAAAAAQEMLLGMVRDPQFGPLVMIGFGGIYVEIFRDTATRLAPLGPAQALAMVEELRMAPALKGARGMPVADLGKLAETICRFAQLACDVQELQQLEVNPLLAGPRGTLAVDLRGRVGSTVAS